LTRLNSLPNRVQRWLFSETFRDCWTFGGPDGNFSVYPTPDRLEIDRTCDSPSFVSKHVYPVTGPDVRMCELEPANGVAVADLVSALGSVLHASLHILYPPPQLVCETPFGTAMGVVHSSGYRPFGGGKKSPAFLSSGGDGV
jgi:hypothetical protein